MGTVYLVSTPIGNLEDITVRAVKTLFSADLILAEDTRRTRILLQELTKHYSSLFPSLLSTAKNIWSYRDQNEAVMIPKVLGELQKGNNVALVTDAGTPLISDPGFKLVRECRSLNVPVVAIPGASSVLTALTASGLPTNPFLFVGYPPEKPGHRVSFFENLKKKYFSGKVTTIAFVAPHKLRRTLTEMRSVFGDIQITLALELTKIHENIWAGSISEALEKFPNPRGEITLLWRI